MRLSRFVIPGLMPALGAAAAMAAHPLQTDDTGTQGRGGAELEHGLSWSRAGDTKTWSFEPQLSYGLWPTFDLIAQASWLRRSEGGGAATLQGRGDTELGAKWRFHADDGPLSLALRAGVTLATHRRAPDEAPGRAAWHVVLIGSVDAAPFAVHGNLGMTQTQTSQTTQTAPSAGQPGERSRIGRVSGALMWAAAERLTLTIDGGAEASPDRSRSTWPGTLLVGAIYSIRPGLDVDIGYQRALRTPVPSRDWLLGLTYRFSP